MRTPGQVRFEVAFHEASHAAAFRVLGRPITRIKICTPEEAARGVEEGAQGKNAGFTEHPDDPLESVAQAQDLIVAILAGEAGVRVAWAAHLFSDEQIGGVEIPTEDLRGLVMYGSRD